MPTVTAAGRTGPADGPTPARATKPAVPPVPAEAAPSRRRRRRRPPAAPACRRRPTRRGESAPRGEVHLISPSRRCRARLTAPAPNALRAYLRGKRVAFVGRLASMAPPRGRAVGPRPRGRRAGASPTPRPTCWSWAKRGCPCRRATRWTIGSTSRSARPWKPARWRSSPRRSFGSGWGWPEPGPDLHRLYTPAMLAELLGVSLAVIRRWHRRGLIAPACEVRRLPYFDFQEVATARRLAQLLAAGVSPPAIEKKLAGTGPLAARHRTAAGPIVGHRPGQRHPLAAGRRAGRARRAVALRLRGRPARRPAGGRTARRRSQTMPRHWPTCESPPASAEQMCRLAADLEEEGQLAAGRRNVSRRPGRRRPQPGSLLPIGRVALPAGRPAGRPRTLLHGHRIGRGLRRGPREPGLRAGRDGPAGLAVAAFEGALRYHAGYADVHYHLARTLDDMGRRAEAEEHWRLFVAMAPDSPWAAEARARLGQ